MDLFLKVQLYDEQLIREFHAPPEALETFVKIYFRRKTEDRDDTMERVVTKLMDIWIYFRAVVDRLVNQ